MEETKSKRHKPKQPKVLAARSVQINEEDASCLIGSILEKGISENKPRDEPFSPITPLMPTVLPFPVARHRSHGPHWNPVRSKPNGRDDNVEDYEDEDEFTKVESVAAFAKPFQKKEKNDLVFRDASASPKKVGKSEQVSRKVGKHIENQETVEKMGKRVPSNPSIASVDALTGMEVDSKNVVLAKTCPSHLEFSTTHFSMEPDHPEIELLKVPPREIAAAQALMEKMDPALLNLLKKRGQDKLKRQKASLLAGSVTNCETECVKGENHLPSSDVYSQQSQVVTSSSPKRTKNNSELAQGVMWDTWTERVEAVRNLRFSLDGVVIEDDFATATETEENLSNIERAAERDFLQAARYTIKEATALIRSEIPGQRTLALNLLAFVLNKASYNIFQSQFGGMSGDSQKVDLSTDWEAVWAYALGPEPELVLALRMALDDSHASVILACARAIRCVLSCDLNETFFDISEKMIIHGKNIFTAPVFRSRPEINCGFLRGGYWKYSAKLSNIIPSHEGIVDDGIEDGRTIQDDVCVAGQDVAAGLLRMEILPRILYLLETELIAGLEESIISILIAIARHSPASVDAVMKYPRLVQNIVNRFNLNKHLQVRASQIKSVCLLKVLALYDRRNCVEFVMNGSFKAVTWHLYQYTSLDSWVKLGKENCKLFSALTVEQLRFWKVCIQNGCCISDFPELFPTLRLWLNSPTFERLTEKDLVYEFALVSKEAYLVLEALAGTLPYIHSEKLLGNEARNEAWAWSYFGTIIDSAMSWISSASELFEWKQGIKGDSVSITSLLWVFSAIMDMISKVLEKVTVNGKGECLQLLPEFVQRVGLETIHNKLLNFSFVDESRYAKDSSRCSSFAEALCCLRQTPKAELSLASVSCLRGLTQIVTSIQNLTGSLVELRCMWNIFRDFVAMEWPLMQSIEVFGRGGPSPGVGLGWGVCGGGFWSVRVLLAQADAHFLCHSLDLCHWESDGNTQKAEELTSMIDRINSALALCLIAGPRDGLLIEKALDFVLQPRTLEYLACCIKSSFETTTRIRIFEWGYKKENYLQASRVLALHFRNRWFSRKRKSKAKDGVAGSRKATIGLEVIHEDMDASELSSVVHYSDSLVVEWAHQRLPIPPHWFLSAISTIYDDKYSTVQSSESLSEDVIEVAKAGVFFLVGIEAMSRCVSSKRPSPVVSVPLVWKLHSLSAVLLTGMDILKDETTRIFYGYLQDLYGQFLSEARLGKAVLGNDHNREFLSFKSDIHENYATFLETLVEQYAAESYGDMVYGRQVSVYLHQCVEPSVRLSAWTLLSSARVLQLLPPLENCTGDANGYLEPIEDNEAILEAFLKSWKSEALDSAAMRGSMAYRLVLHHFSSFIFCHQINDKLSLRNKIVKSLLRDYSQKQHRERMLLSLIRYNKQSANPVVEDIEEKFKVLKEACKGNHALISLVEKLKLSLH